MPIPANPNALTLAKSLNCDSETIKQLGWDGWQDWTAEEKSTPIEVTDEEPVAPVVKRVNIQPVTITRQSVKQITISRDEDIVAETIKRLQGRLD